MYARAAALLALVTGTAAARAQDRQADVFEVSPLETPGLARVTLDLPAGAERLATGALEVLNCPDTGACSEIRPGSFYHACQPTPLARADAGGNFIYPYLGDTDPDDQLPEVMAFYQAGKALAAAGELGLPPLAERLQVVVNFHRHDGSSLADCADGDYDGEVPLEPLDTAYFTATGEGLGLERDGFHLVLPQGHAIDHALDGDVVQHEVGHAVMATVAPALPRTLLDRFGTDPSPGGLHEGFADLLVVMVTGDPVIGAYAGSGKGDGGPLRDLREPAGCPEDQTGEPHADSRPFTSGVWRAREEVAAGDPARARAFDRALAAAWRRLGPAAGYQRATSLIAAELEGALGAGAGAAARAVFERHGLTGCGGRVVDAAAGKPLAALPGAPEGGGAAPGIFQLRLDLERPAAAIAIEVAVLDTSTPELTRASALLKGGGEPIAWQAAAGGPRHDAEAEAELAVDGERRARAELAGPFAPGVYHLMLVNHGPRATLYDTRAAAEPLPDDGGCRLAPAPPGVLAAAAVLLLLIRGARRGRRRPAARRRW